jgi:glycosyltransferase involved in cell wall biosynthesis
MFEWEKQRLRKYLPISIIVPTYNRANYLLETLNAILAQQDKDLEVIVVDDCSTDDSRIVLESFKKQYPQIILVFLEENLGESNAVNVGWSLASKQFISIVNSDDPPDKNWLRDMSNGIALNPGFGFYYPNRMVIDANSAILRREILKGWSTKVLYGRLIPIASAGLIIDRVHLPKCFEPRDKEIVFPSDLIQMFNLGLFTIGCKIPHAWGVWRDHGDSFSSKKNSEEKALSFELNVTRWINENYSVLKNYVKPQVSKSYLYAHIWKILRQEKGLVPSMRFMLRGSVKREIMANPQLAFWLLAICISYFTSRLIQFPSRVFAKLYIFKKN